MSEDKKFSQNIERDKNWLTPNAFMYGWDESKPDNLQDFKIKLNELPFADKETQDIVTCYTELNKLTIEQVINRLAYNSPDNYPAGFGGKVFAWIEELFVFGSNYITPNFFLGIVVSAKSVVIDGYGTVIELKVLRRGYHTINTSSYTVGQRLYVDRIYSNLYTLSTVIPNYAPSVEVATVIKQGTTDGVIYVNPIINESFFVKTSYYSSEYFTVISSITKDGQLNIKVRYVTRPGTWTATLNLLNISFGLPYFNMIHDIRINDGTDYTSWEIPNFNSQSLSYIYTGMYGTTAGSGHIWRDPKPDGNYYRDSTSKLNILKIQIPPNYQQIIFNGTSHVGGDIRELHLTGRIFSPRHDKLWTE